MISSIGHKVRSSYPSFKTCTISSISPIHSTTGLLVELYPSGSLDLNGKFGRTVSGAEDVTELIAHSITDNVDLWDLALDLIQ